MTRFRRPSFAARRPVKDARQLRAEWMASLEMAADLARAAEAEDPTAVETFGVTMTRLRVAIRDLEPANFPATASSAQTMAAAWLRLIRDFVAAGWSPEARTACAPFLKAGCACLDRLITTLRTEEARGTRQILGERDED